MSALGKLVHNVREAWEVPRDLLLDRYPPFVTGGALPRPLNNLYGTVGPA